MLGLFSLLISIFSEFMRMLRHAIQCKKPCMIRRKISISLILSLIVHLFFLFGASFLPKQSKIAAVKAKIPVKLQLSTKSPATDLAPKKILINPAKKQRIVEAPLLPTEKPIQPAFLGAQNHRTTQEVKTAPGAQTAAADPTPLQNGRLRLETMPRLEGRLKVPAGKTYREYLPQKIDIVNQGHNDFFPDKKMPIGPVLDVNTTDFRFIAYFTAVRKQVELAYYDVGPSLQDKSYVREKIANTGQANLQGSSLIRLKVARSGLLVETKLVDSSGDKDVDSFWDRILNLAAPYPPLPRDFPDEELLFTYQLYYDLSFQGERKSKRFMF